MSWGIVGTGAMAARFAVACKAAGADVAAVASRTATTGEDFAHRFGIPRAVEGAAALAALPDVSRVYIATPNTAHVPDCLASIAAGKAVLCEKPLAVTADGAKVVADAARQAGVFCMEAMWSLCLPNYIEAFAAVRNGEIGELSEIQGSFATPQSATTMPRLFTPDGGGALLDRGIYLLALSQALMGPLQLKAVHGTVGTGGVDLSATLMVENTQGKRAVLTAAIDRLGDNRLTLWGSHGRIQFEEPVSNPASWRLTQSDPERGFVGPKRLPGTVARLKARLSSQRQLRATLQALRGSRGHSGGLEHQIRHVDACLAAEQTQSDLVPLDSSIAVLGLIDAARERLNDTAAEV